MTSHQSWKHEKSPSKWGSPFLLKDGLLFQISNFDSCSFLKQWEFRDLMYLIWSDQWLVGVRSSKAWQNFYFVSCPFEKGHFTLKRVFFAMYVFWQLIFLLLYLFNCFNHLNPQPPNFGIPGFLSSLCHGRLGILLSEPILTVWYLLVSKFKHPKVFMFFFEACPWIWQCQRFSMSPATKAASQISSRSSSKKFSKLASLRPPSNGKIKNMYICSWCFHQ